MLSSTKRQGLANPDSQMPPSEIAIEGDDYRISRVSRNDVSKAKVQQQLGVSPSALVNTSPTTASAALEGQLSTGFHPSALAS